MKISAQPADLRASDALGTVKKRTITCGSPAVPTIRASVMQKTSIMLLDPSVYSPNPRSVSTRLSFCNTYSPDPSLTWLPRPNCGIGLPVIMKLRKKAGTM